MAREDQMIMDEELEKIDLMGALYELSKALRRFWLPVLIVTILGAVGGYFTALRSYTPTYKAFSSLIIQAGTGHEGSFMDSRTAGEMGSTFSYVATSGVLRKVVARELEMNQVQSEITADVMAESNLLTITVLDRDPEIAYTVLQSVINNYPTVAEYIVGPSTFTIIDESGVPTHPVNGSNEKRRAVMAALAAFALCCVILMIYSRQRRTILQGEDLKEITSAKLLGNIPSTRMKKRSSSQALLLDNPKITSPFKESMRLARSRMEKALRDTYHPVLLVTSSIAGEGKTLFAVNLALGLAQKGSRVALVDGDFRHPSVANSLGMDNIQKTLPSYLNGNCSIEDITYNYKEELLTVFPAGERVSNPVSLIRSTQMEAFIISLKDHYDYVIIDTPPSSLLSDAAGFYQVADYAIFVVRQDYTSETQCRHALETITDAGIPLIGYIMNGVIEGTTGYGYSSYGYGSYGYRRYGYGYGYGYGNGYGSRNSDKKKNDNNSDASTRKGIFGRGAKIEGDVAVEIKEDDI